MLLDQNSNRRLNPEWEGLTVLAYQYGGRTIYHDDETIVYQFEPQVSLDNDMKSFTILIDRRYVYIEHWNEFRVSVYRRESE